MKKFRPFKIRPFNMANFSGGSGYLVFVYVYILIGTQLFNIFINIPLTLITTKIAKSGGWVKAKTIKRGLNFVFIPTAVVLTIVLTFVYMFGLGFIYEDTSIVSFIAYVFCAASPFIIIYLAIITAVNTAEEREKAALDDINEKEVKGSSFILRSIAFTALYSFMAFPISLVFNAVIDSVVY